MKSEVISPIVPANVDQETRKFYESLLQMIKEIRREGNTDSSGIANKCQLILNTYAGYGSTDTKIMRFTNKVEGYGSAFTENHTSGYSSNAKGLEITINKAGKYSFSFTGMAPAGSGDRIGLSIDSTQLTTDINAITTANRLGVSTAVTGTECNFSISLYLTVGRVIRPHSLGFLPVTASVCNFTATYIGP